MSITILTPNRPALQWAAASRPTADVGLPLFQRIDLRRRVQTEVAG